MSNNGLEAALLQFQQGVVKLQRSLSVAKHRPEGLQQ